MKIQSRGFATILILLAVAVLAIGGAGVMYSQKLHTSSQSILTASTTQKATVSEKAQHTENSESAKDVTLPVVTSAKIPATAPVSAIDAKTNAQVSTSNSKSIPMLTINPPEGWSVSSRTIGPENTPVKTLGYASPEVEAGMPIGDISIMAMMDGPNVKPDPRKDREAENVSVGKTIVSGISADVYEYDANYGSTNVPNTIHYKMLYVVKNKYAYLIFGQYKVGVGEKYIETINQALNSIVLP